MNISSAFAPPTLVDGILEFPVHHMRGGTSTGLVIWENFAPRDEAMREELLRHIMGVPHAGAIRNNRQITGLGRGSPTSNKVFFVSQDGDGRGLVSTLAQLAGDHRGVDWSVNCGNMSSAILPWAIDVGLIPAAIEGETEATIHRCGDDSPDFPRRRFLRHRRNTWRAWYIPSGGPVHARPCGLKDR